MTDVELRRAPRDDPDRALAVLNALVDRDLGNAGTPITLYGYAGTRQNPVGGGTPLDGRPTTGNYTLDVHSAHASGLLAAFRLPATTRVAAPTVANCAALIQAVGLLVGAGKALRLYSSGGTNYVELSSDANGGIVLGGVGTGVGALTATKITLTSALPIVLTGTAARITGPFENVTRGNRPFFQSSAANGDTNVSAAPSGANTISKFEAYNNATPGTATGIASLEANATEVRLSAAFASGTGLPLQLYAGNVKMLDISATTGVVSLPLGQLAFPASQNPSSNANTLDDYEEGTWTPNVGGSATYTAQVGKYTKVGNLVTFTCRMTINAIGTGSTTTIFGLPFAAAENSGALPMFWANLTAAYTNLTGLVASGASTIQMFGSTVAAASLTGVTPFQNSSGIQLFGLYHV